MLDAFLCSWPAAPWFAISLIVTAIIYSIGWRELNYRDPVRWNAGRLVAFIAGLAALYLALASPIDVFASFLLSAHMLQHLLLLMVFPPLIWLGWPLLPMLRGLPEPVRTYWAAPVLRSRRLAWFMSRLVHPLIALPIFVVTTWGWHLPPAYSLSLSADRWHIVQHLCFIAAALIFWFPVVRPYPTQAKWPKWWLLPYLLIADLQNTVLAAWITFSPQVLYLHYLQMPRINGISAIDDQKTAGVLMWVPGSIALLLPLFWITISYLLGSHHDASSKARSHRMQLRTRPSSFDALTLPVVGAILRSRRGRRVLQVASLAIAALIVLDGFRGPQFAPLNFAGVVPWIHWRGALILTLLVAGNFFCMACPFTLSRGLAKRLVVVERPWPRALRSKWAAVLLVAIFLWSYESFTLWNNVWITAWIVLAYFLAAFLVDTFFKGGSFCKYVCPIGQFNFVQSLMSPLTVAVRQPAVCSTCTTHECITGSAVVNGCESKLFLPSKHGNLDCTFCLDCTRACPHDNVGVLVSLPANTLWIDPHRAGIGRFSRRPDLAALVLILVFGAFANAAGMIAPVVEWQRALWIVLGRPSLVLINTLCYLVALVILPLLLVSFAAFVSKRWARLDETALRVATRFAFALVPVGFGMWVAHYSFHFFTSWQSMLPVTQRFAIDNGLGAFGEPSWQCACCLSAAAWIPHFELLMLDFGLLGSLYTAFRIAEMNAKDMVQAAKVFAPWATIVVILFILGTWIIFQPMEMRGTLQFVGW